MSDDFKGIYECVDSSLWSREFAVAFVQVVLGNVEDIERFYKSSDADFDYVMFGRFSDGSCFMGSYEHSIEAQIDESSFSDALNKTLYSLLFNGLHITQSHSFCKNIPYCDEYDFAVVNSSRKYLGLFRLEFKTRTIRGIIDQTIARLERNAIAEQCKELPANNNKKGVRL